jgi:hypothetical protein
MTHGQCLCGAVRFTINGPVRDIFVCHCSICRRLHGGPANYSACEMDELHMDSADELRHFDVADATYSFCGTCGSRLFWRRPSLSYVAVSAASLDQPTGLHTLGHIFVGSAGDYEDLSTALPKHVEYSGSSTV